MTGAIGRIVVALALVALAIAACGGAPTVGGPVASPQITCTGLPPEKCDEAVKSVARSLPGEHPIAIEVTCSSGACTLANGFMDTVVTLPDGRQLHGITLSWGDGTQGGGGFPVPAPPVPMPPGGPGVVPAPAVAPICQGVPVAQCTDMGLSMSAEAGHGDVLKIVVRCLKVPCTAKSGEGDTVYTYMDGTTSTSNWGYESAG
jgi:hypothetical protein